ncbi:DUF3305 domain-containing protein [Poseidonocella sedimentorum]|nr:DUF3305 domain-containing protein [Poseidonocella sedimentorum]
MDIGVVIRQSPGVTRWAKWVWRAVALLPGAGPADWHVMRREGEVTEFHAGTRRVELFRSDCEAYAENLATREPSLFVVMREPQPGQPGAGPLELTLVTASPFEAQDYCDSGEEIVEKVPMPPVVRDWVENFVMAHEAFEPFKKRRRDKRRIDLREDGIGDPRIAQISDVYRSPTLLRAGQKGRLQ